MCDLAEAADIIRAREADVLTWERARNAKGIADYYRKAAPYIAADPLEHTRRVLAGVTCRAELQAFHP
jgi:hypothetical protein